MQTRTYTVNVPERFPDLGSDKVARVLEAVVAERLELAPDIVGSGPKALRLTVNESDAEALQELAGGASMAAAFRRLFSTAVGVRPRLGSGGAHIVDVAARPESKAILPAGIRVRQDVPMRSLAVPPWFDPDNPNRVYYWRSLGVDMQLQVIEAQEPATVSAPPRVEARAQLVAALLLSLAFVLFLYMVPILAHFFGAAPSGSASSGSGFREWRPE